METKSLLVSKTFWGAIIAIVASLAGFAGYTFGANDQQAVVEIITTVGTAIGGLLAIFGRIKATKPIK
jgi:uncharacterized membrane protein